MNARLALAKRYLRSVERDLNGLDLTFDSWTENELLVRIENNLRGLETAYGEIKKSLEAKSGNGAVRS